MSATDRGGGAGATIMGNPPVPLLSTKLTLPPGRPGLVARPRAIQAGQPAPLGQASER